MRKNFMVVVLVFSLAALACRMGEAIAQRPENQIPVSTEDARKFEDNLKATVDSFTATGKLDIEVTESQLTSFVYFKTLEQPEIGITDPQIYLRDGKIQMHAKYSENIIPVDIALVITPLISEGMLKMQLDSVKLGPASAPDAMVEQFQRIITEQIEPSLNQSITGGLNIETLSISNGVLTLHGTKP